MTLVGGPPAVVVGRRTDVRQKVGDLVEVWPFGGIVIAADAAALTVRAFSAQERLAYEQQHNADTKDEAMQQAATYRAYFEDNLQSIYCGHPGGNLVGALPLGARPAPKGECGTLDRADGGDPYERAVFVSYATGRTIIVEREGDA